MKKVISLLLALVFILSCFSGCSTETGKTFTVGFDASFPPYGYKDGDDYVGFDIDLAKEVAKRNDWEIKLQPIDWNAKDMELNSGTIDCIWNGFTINGREDEYTWSDAYVDNSQVFVVKSNSGIKTFEDLAGKNVTAQADSSAEAALKDDENQKMVALLDSLKELKTVTEYNTAFMELEAGSTDAIAMDIGVAEYQIETRDSDKFVILEETISTEQYGVGFKLGNTELRDTVQKTLDEMMADGTFLKIAEEWDLETSVIIK